MREDGSLAVAAWGDLGPTVDDGWMLSRGARRHERDALPQDVAELLARRDVAALAEVLPPFAALRTGPAREEAVAVTDALGFRHVYHAEGRGWAAISTSARLLAVLGGRDIDRESMSLQSLVGWQVGQWTLFDGVSKLAPGAVAQLGAGELTIHGGDRPTPEPLSLDDAVEQAAELLRTNLSAYLGDHPDATLQLTGGQDSRILLSAIPPDLRRGLAAVTLAVPGSEDVSIAAEICARTGARHHVEALDSLEGLDPAAAYDLCTESSARLEGMADPLALAALTMAERRLDQGHRIAGLGGEVARGFYYLGRPRDPSVTRARVARLASWRMFANEAIDPASLEPSMREGARERAVERIHGLMAGTGKDWLDATDDFYLYQRMQRWAGVTDTAVCMDRSVVNPMLDDRFIAIAQGMSPDSKRNSLFLARLQMALDPELGRMPLNGRPPPEAYAYPRHADRVRGIQTLAQKAASKARQRFAHSTRPPAGGTVLAAKVLRHWRANPDLLDRARGQHVLDDSWLDRMVRGELDPAPSTVAFVLNVACLPSRSQTSVSA
ncbi:hypothetical protein CXG46_18450 [Nocardioides alpinus]|uniref:Asparagine synthase (Glutamine-hydrolysing) n=1 Tax=Nocardioides alpinus TaxID=748909 RepID=A0ABX4QSW7_9ACTN|nr:hypothetical protein CXG46_18450 [Nocardioides alpinus]